MALKKTISERCWCANQSWNYEHLFTVEGNSLRVSIRRNAYDAQSYARVARFDGSKWQPVASRSIGECSCRGISYVSTDVECQSFLADATTLEEEAIAILGL